MEKTKQEVEEEKEEEEIYKKVQEYIKKNKKLNKDIKILEAEISTENEALYYWWFREYGSQYENSDWDWPEYQKSHNIEDIKEIIKLPFTDKYILWLDKWFNKGRIIKLH